MELYLPGAGEASKETTSNVINARGKSSTVGNCWASQKLNALCDETVLKQLYSSEYVWCYSGFVQEGGVKKKGWGGWGTAFSVFLDPLNPKLVSVNSLKLAFITKWLNGSWVWRW